jgi:glycosyltransferase involved in cell wall biosynthesis
MILLEDPELRRSMKQDAMNWVEEMFSIAAMKEQLSKYIDEVVREI